MNDKAKKLLDTAKVESLNDITGIWERKNDDFSGIRLKVVRLESGDFRGTLVKLNDLAKQGGYVVNDVKWKDIKKINNGTFDIKDLGKDQYGIYWYDMELTYDKENNTIKLVDIANNKEKVGSQQTWVKVVQ